MFWGALKGLLAPCPSGSFHAYPKEASLEEWDPLSALLLRTQELLNTVIGRWKSVSVELNPCRSL